MYNLKSSFNSFGQVISFLTSSFQLDAILSDEDAIRSDWNRVGLDLSNTIGGYDESFKRKL